MLDNAITLAVLISTAFYMAYKKMPRNVRKWIVKHNLLIDVVCMLMTYYTLGGTVTALIAGAIVDIIISAMLHVGEHPEDFIWLFDIIERVKEFFRTLQVKLKEWNESNKERHPDANPPKPLFAQDTEPVTVAP